MFAWRCSRLGFILILLAGCSSPDPSSTELQASHSQPDPDQRIVVSLTAEQRLHVLEEMNQFLLSTQEIVEGLASDDAELIQSAVSDGLGRGQGQGQGQGLVKGALPTEFRQMGSAMKVELRKIDTLSKAGAENAEILDQLSSTLMYCSSCHGSYQIRLNETPLITRSAKWTLILE